MNRSTVASVAAGVAAGASAVAVLAAGVAAGAAAVAVLGDFRLKRRAAGQLGDRVGAALEKTRHAVEWAEARRQPDAAAADG